MDQHRVTTVNKRDLLATGKFDRINKGEKNNMKKAFLFSVISCLLMTHANAATPWWEQPTICRLSPSNCYTNMGIGYFYDNIDPESWDITSSCWGKKYICVEALTVTYKEEHNNPTQPVAMAKTEIRSSVNIDSDFDVDVLNGDCFGVRKTSSGGAMASVDGNFVKVWCSGVLEHPDDEYVENGEITSGEQPKCSDLQANGYVGIQNGKCYGKYYDPQDYYIQCDSEDKNATLIVLNGAQYSTTSTSSITTKREADDLFDIMYQNAKVQHAAHFGE